MSWQKDWEEEWNRIAALIFSDEPIRKEDAQKEDTAQKSKNRPEEKQKRGTPDQILQLKKLMAEPRSSRYDYWNYAKPFAFFGTNTESARRFLREAALMETYTDDRPLPNVYEDIFPVSYESMNMRQLRGYFSWRTLVLQGEYPDVPFFCVELYLDELLNGIGAKDEADGYEKIRAIWEAYRGRFPERDAMVRRWMFHYVVYHNMDPVLLSFTETVQRDKALCVLFSLHEHSREEVYEALCRLSSYRLKRSRFVKEHPMLFTEVCIRVLFRLKDYYDKNRKTDLWESMFGICGQYVCHMFDGSLFYDKSAAEEQGADEVCYDVDPVCYFTRQNGKWTAVGYFLTDKDKMLGDILRSVDAQMRAYCQYPYPLKDKLDTKYVKRIIDREIRSFLQERQRKEQERQRKERQRRQKQIHIDLDQLDDIRREAERTRQRLMTEEEQAEEEPLKQPKEEENPAAAEKTAKEEAKGRAYPFSLTADEYVLLLALLREEDCRDYFLSHHLMLSVAAESVNEKLFDAVGDCVIAFDEEEPHLLPEYRDEVFALMEEEEGGTE